MAPPLRLAVSVLLALLAAPFVEAQMPLIIANYIGHSSQQLTQASVNATSLLLSCDGTTMAFFGNELTGNPPQVTNAGLWVVPTSVFRAQAMLVPRSSEADMAGFTTDGQLLLFRANQSALYAAQPSSPTKEPTLLTPADAMGSVSGAQTQLAAPRCGCTYSVFTSPDGRKVAFGVDGNILFRTSATSNVQALAAPTYAPPYTLQCIGNSGFLAIASPTLLFVSYGNVTVGLSAADAVADPVGAVFCQDEKNVVWMQDDALYASTVTGALSKLTDAANVTAFQCSPDSKVVVFLSNGDLYAVAVTGAGGPVKLSPEMAVVAPSDSPTGDIQVGVVNAFAFAGPDTVAFTAQTLAGVTDLTLASQLYLVSTTNLTLVQLSESTADYPALSPSFQVSCDGSYAVYSTSIANDTEHVALFSVALRFSNASATLNLSPEDTSVAVPWPDGVRISFDSQYISYASISADSGGNQCVYTRALRSPGITLQATNILPSDALGVFDAIPFSLDLLVWRSEAQEALSYVIMRNKADAAMLGPVAMVVLMLLAAVAIM